MADCMHGIEDEWCADCHPSTAGPGSVLDHAIDIVSMLIPGDGEAPLPKDILIAASGLPPYLVDKAVAAIRERHPDLPLVSDRNGIRFTMDEAAVRKFRNSAARSALTRIRRAWRGALQPFLENSGIPEIQLRLLERMFSRVMEDIQDLVDANGTGH